jgi:transcriptional regulator with XRE-family HTH domain
MDTEFVTWLIEEMEQRGWNNSELARRADVVPSTVSMIVSGQKRPGLDFCTGVARAFRMPPEIVLRKAGILPGATEDQVQDEELLSYFHALSGDERERVITITRALYENRAEYKCKTDQDEE